MKTKFEILGSKENVFYNLYLEEKGNGLRVFCNCSAGQHGTLCKHVRTVLYKDFSLVKHAQDELLISEILEKHKSVLAKLFIELEDLEEKEQEIKVLLRLEKINIVDKMRNGL